MQCRRCGKELGNALRCSFCGYDNTEGNVREMTNIEKKFFDGVTIDAGTEENNSSGSTSNANSNSYRRSFNRGTTSRRTFYTYSSPGILSKLFNKLIGGLINNNMLAKVAATLIVFALGALAFFIAVPVLFVILAIGIALFTVTKIGG